MNANILLQEICNLLETYKGRDKVMRTLCYSAKLAEGLVHDKSWQKKLSIFSSKMSATRAVLRLFDDLPMLQYTLEYGLGKQEPDKFMASLGVVTNVIDQIYYPIEKLSWLAEHKLLEIDGSKWDITSSIFWVLSIYLTLMKSLRYVMILQRHKLVVDMNEEYKYTLKKIVGQQKMELLTCLRLSLDFVHAVNTLPPGFLWSSKLNTWNIGLIGTISSVLGIYQIYAKRMWLNK